MNTPNDNLAAALDARSKGTFVTPSGSVADALCLEEVGCRCTPPGVRAAPAGEYGRLVLARPGAGRLLLPAPMETPRDILGIALDARNKGIVAIPVAAGAKSPPLVKWKPWQSGMPPLELQERWFRDTRVNVAIITTGMVVFDVDDPAKAELVLAACGDTPHKLRTPRGGIHLGYRRRKGVEMHNQVRIKGMPIDVRTDGGLELIAPSRTADGEYRWVGGGLRPVDELPVATVGWTRERTRRRVVRSVEAGCDSDAMARRARAYVANIEGAVSGQRGHDRTFRVACVLTHKFGLPFERAWPIFLEWNQTCEPPWSDAELAHKLTDAIRKRG